MPVSQVPAAFARQRSKEKVSLAVRPLRVVVVDEELPYPLTSGKRIRTLNLLLRLADRHQITYLCHRNVDPQEARQAAEYLRDHGIETVVVDQPLARKSGALFYARLAANLFSPLPYSVASHNSHALRAAIREYARRHEVDLWHCEWTPYAAPLSAVMAGRRLVMAHNIESMIWQRYHQTEANPLKRWYIKRQWRKFEWFERRAFAEATRLVAVSAEDAAIARERFGAPRVSVVDNGVDTSYFQPQSLAREPNRLLFLGSLDWRPNQDAVRVLLEGIFPAVAAQESSARLDIVGRNPPAWLISQAGNHSAVELHANVPDVRPFIARSGMMAVPLRIGGGSRLKILEALACEMPVVSTKVGAEGLCLVPGRDLAIVDRVGDMPRALVECIRHPRTAREMARHGRQVVLARYDWDALADQLEGIWLECAKQ